MIATADISRLGFEPDDGNSPDTPRFKSTDKRGLMLVSYDNAQDRCVMDYGGPGSEQIAGVIRDVATENGLVHILNDDNGSAQGSVFQGTAPGSTKVSRIIIVENRKHPSTSVSYSEK